jgi:hypothetical protein
MNDNWWTMQRMIETRERELRLRMETIKPWIRQRTEGGKGGKARPVRYAIGRTLLAWGSALTANGSSGSQH